MKAPSDLEYLLIGADRQFTSHHSPPESHQLLPANIIPLSVYYPAAYTKLIFQFGLYDCLPVEDWIYQTAKNDLSAIYPANTPKIT